jgi:hypothetical protein
MTTQVTDRSSAQPVGPPPPFDPELAPVVEMLNGLRPPSRLERHGCAVSWGVFPR